MDKAVIRVQCNPPAGFRGSVHFMLGIRDETVAEGHAGETLTFELEPGSYEIQILVRNEGLNSMSGTSVIDAEGELDMRFKYALFGKRAILVPASKK